LELLIPVTVNVPLKELFAIPVGLLELAILIISTLDPTFNSCGTSVIILATLFPQRAFATILKFLNSVEFERVDVVLLY